MLNRKTTEKCTNRYELVNVVSKRARQLVSEDAPKVETKETSEVTISSLEFERDKYSMLEK